MQHICVRIFRAARAQPISGSNPLFALIFSYIFLRDVERVTSRTVLATLLIVSGIALITF